MESSRLQHYRHASLNDMFEQNRERFRGHPSFSNMGTILTHGIPTLIAGLHKTRFTAIAGVNTLFNVLLDTPGFEKAKQVNADALKVAVSVLVEKSGEMAITHCKTNLAAYKTQKQIELRDTLPKSAIGNILHRQPTWKPAPSGEAAI